MSRDSNTQDLSALRFEPRPRPVGSDRHPTRRIPHLLRYLRGLAAQRPGIGTAGLYALLFAASFAATTALRLRSTDRPVARNPASAAATTLQHLQTATQDWWADRQAEPESGRVPAPAPAQAPPPPPVRALEPPSSLDTEPQVLELRVRDQTLRHLEDAAQRDESAAGRLAALNTLISLAGTQPDPDGRIKELIRMSTGDADETIAQAAQAAYAKLLAQTTRASER